MDVIAISTGSGKGKVHAYHVVRTTKITMTTGEFRKLISPFLKDVKEIFVTWLEKCEKDGGLFTKPWSDQIFFEKQRMVEEFVQLYMDY